MALLSIITPFYNMSETFEKTLQSIPFDNAGTIEHIVIDDFSDEEHHMKVKELIESYEHCYLKRNKRNIGPVESCNIGAKISSGKYILFLSADDYVRTDNLRELIFNHLPNIEASIISYNIEIFNETIKYCEKTTYAPYKSDTYISPEVVSTMRTPPVHGQIMLKRDTYMEYGPYLKKLGWNCDLYLHLKIALDTGIYFIPQTVTCFRKRINSYGNKKTYEQQSKTFDFLIKLLNQKDNTKLKDYYVKKGLLGREPYSLRYLMLNGLFDYINFWFIIDHIIYKLKRFVFHLVSLLSFSKKIK